MEVVVVVVVVMVVVEAKMEDGRWKMEDGRVATMMMTAGATNDVNDGEHEGKRVVLYNWRCAIIRRPCCPCRFARLRAPKMQCRRVSDTFAD